MKLIIVIISVIIFFNCAFFENEYDSILIKTFCQYRYMALVEWGYIEGDGIVFYPSGVVKGNWEIVIDRDMDYYCCTIMKDIHELDCYATI